MASEGQVRVAAVCFAALLLAASASAQVTFYTDETAFENALTTGNPSEGPETFEESTVAPNDGGLMFGSLCSGTPNDPFFPAGLTGMPGLCMSQETIAQLDVIGAGFFGNPSVVVGTDLSNYALVLSFDSPKLAVSLELLVRSPIPPDPRDVTIEVSADGGARLGSTLVSGVGSTPVFAGLIADPGQEIHSIRIDGPADVFELVDNIETWGAAPAPATPEWGLLALALLLLATLWRSTPPDRSIS